MAATERLQSLGVNETCGARGEHTHTYWLVLCCFVDTKCTHTLIKINRKLLFSC